MPKTIAMTGQKGGAGKTTAAVCLAAEAIERGLAVLLVDADPQGTSSTWGEVGAEAKRKMPTVIAMGALMHRDGQLTRISQPYDLVIVDCPPRHGDIQRAALMVADLALLPCGPTAVDAWALRASLDLVQDARQLRPELGAALFITRKQGRTSLGKSAREVLATSGLPVLQAELSYRVAFQEALAAGEGVSTYAAGTPAAQELRALYDEIDALLTPTSKRKNGRKEEARHRTSRTAAR